VAPDALLFEPLAQKVQRLAARARQVPSLRTPLHQRPPQVARQEILLERSMGEAEPVLAFAHQERGRAQVLLEQLPVFGFRVPPPPRPAPQKTRGPPPHAPPPPKPPPHPATTRPRRAPSAPACGPA